MSSTSNAATLQAPIDRSHEGVAESPYAPVMPARSGATSVTQDGFAVAEFEVGDRGEQRRIATMTSDNVRLALLRRHQELAMREVLGTLTRKERCKLALVRWELDRLRDVEIGPALDFWRQVADAQEGLASQIQSFAAQAEELTVRRQRGSGKGGSRR